MRQARALPLPNEALYIEEIRFWLGIMQEHTKFIRGGLPAEAAEFQEDVKEFFRAFSSLLQQTEKVKSIKQSKEFIKEILEVMMEFERFQRKILAEIFQGKLKGTNFPFFLDHMLREADYFCTFLNRMLEEKGVVKAVSHTRELVIWLRFMTDHTKLIRHYIDPSECRMIKMADEFIILFDHLVLEARDLASMLYRHKGEVKVFRRFLLDIRMDVQRLRDFDKMAEDLIRDCRLLGIVSVELASHMRREAEHCLLKIALLEKEFLKHCPEDFQDDADDAVWEAVERNDAEKETTKLDGEYERDEEVEAWQDTENTEQLLFEARKDQIEERREETEAVVALMEPVLPENISLVPEEEIQVAISQGGELRGENDSVRENEESEIQIEEKSTLGAVEKKTDPIYIKPMERQVMPRSFAPLAPRERYDKTKNLLPRPLGKTKK